MRERPGDTAAVRDLGRTRLDLVSWLFTLARFDEALTEIARARVVIEPLAREHPGDGGARWLEAECDSLEGAALSYSVRTTPAIEALRRARAGFEALVRDNPPYTLPTTADGPTEYRRGLAQVLHWIGWTLVDVGDFAGALDAGREQKEVVTSLVTGPFAADTDRLDLGKADRLAGFNLRVLGRHEEAVSSQCRALAVAREVADANPTSAAYRAELALGLEGLAQSYVSTDLSSARRCALEALATIQSLPMAQRDRYELVKVESNCARIVSICAADAGRMDEALRYARQSVTVCEEAARIHPDSPFFVTNFLADSLVQLAMVELGSGRPGAALRIAEAPARSQRRPSSPTPSSANRSSHLISSLLLRGVILLRSGRAADASRAAEEAARRLAEGGINIPGGKRFFQGAVEGFFYALGRPNAPGRPAEAPGLKEHADRAVAEAREASRLGFRNLRAVAMLNEVLGRPVAMQPMMMDQLFPVNPFEPEPGSDDDGAALRRREIPAMTNSSTGTGPRRSLTG